jgi:rod shape-determining protein MreC
VYNTTVRRRRAVAVLLAALSLTFLTAYFGETAGGVLHALQRGVLQVLAPVQEGAGKALKPFQDLAGWFDDTLDARGERDQLRKERDELRRQVILNEAAASENKNLRRLLALDRGGLVDYVPVTARVIGRSPTVWYATITLDKGSVDGIRVNHPVVTGDGLVGKVTAVTRGAAQVTLITDHTSGVSAKVLTPEVGSDPNSANGVYGMVKTAVGDPGDLLLDFVSRNYELKPGDRVVTAGSRSNRLESLFPPNIPIGVVTKVDAAEFSQYQRVHISPFADFRKMTFVQVLTGRSGDAGEDRAQAP